MKLSNRLQRVCGVILLGLALGCGDSTPLGSIECIGERIRCGFTEKQEQQELPRGPDQIERVSSTALDVLTPTLSARPFEDLPSLEFSLIVDSDGELWTVRRAESRIVLVKRDRGGIALEEHSIAPPKGTRKPERYLVASVAPQSRGSSLTRDVLTVRWSRHCDQGAPDCEIEEVLVFDSFDEAPRRSTIEWLSGTVQADESGAWLLDGSVVDKRDNRGNLVWRQTGHLALRAPGFSWSSRGALRQDNELSALISPTAPGFTQDAELLRLDSLGNIVKRQPLSSVGESPEYTVDPQGRDVIAGTTSAGDLTLTRVRTDGSLEGGVIERREYVDLRADSFALDSDGAAYVTSRAGGREPSELRRILCQLPAFGRVRCFTLGDLETSESNPFLFDTMVVPEPGVVYVRSGFDLRRYELPPL